MEHFDGPGLDTDVWIPHYLPHWSSRAQSAATYTVIDSELRLTIPPEQGLWCPDDHDPIRVSGIQSGLVSGQQAFADGLVVKEPQPSHYGWTPHHGRIEVRARMDLSPRSMTSVWMVGLEEEPNRCGEICVFEVFGDALEPGRAAAVGMGVHPFRDPALTDDFAAPRLELDVTEHHTYTAEWSDERVDFVVDGTRVRSVGQAPAYPMQMMVAVFDFPAHERAQAHAGHVPLLAVDRIEGH